MDNNILIKIPNDIKSEFEGFNYFIDLYNSLLSIYNSKVIFDFSNVTFFEANLSTILGVICEMLTKNINSIELQNIQPQVDTILRKNKFLTYFGGNAIFDQYDTSLDYKKFIPSDDEGFNNYIENQLLGKKDFPKLSSFLSKEIVRNIFEIYENARTHGKCDFIHTCGQFYPRKNNKPLHFTIVDKGINIKQNVSNYLNYNISSEDAIEWAMVKGNTTKTGETSGGLGLSVIFDFIKLNKGKIQIISCDGYYEYFNGIINKSKINNKFDGTIINIIFNMNDSNHYRLKNEPHNNGNIF